MLHVSGPKYSLCDGLTRRSALQIGGLALGGLSLPQILKAENQAGTSKNEKGVIMIFLPGGPPHQDMWDIKTDAPSEIRGEFAPIATNVPGIEIGELFPQVAQNADKCAFIRSMVGATGQHFAFQCLTGNSDRQQPPGGWPSLGSVLSHVYGPKDPAVPPFVGLSPKTRHAPWGDPGQPGFLGVAHAPFQPNGQGMADMTLNGISVDRLSDRKRVLASLDTFRRDADASGMMDGMDAFTEQAFGILTSSKLADALDVEKEPVAIRDRYGRGSAKLQSDGGPKLLDHFLVARRLIEAGVRCVSLCFSRWDWHSGNFKRGREDMPMLDQALSALLEDLDQRGMLDTTSVVVWGEFGRTPKINTNGGRDHWPRVSCALLAGGGMKTGQVIGSTNRLGEYAETRPVHFQEVFATLYRNLGINIDQLTLNDLQGRPRYLIDHNTYRPLPELIG
ncbi:DUF1501 domain-containing protein [Rubinisphaera brasiliensis]|uniref:DUF1501 domain-containing protein n=1 Tax=Rubinisphaera brasiliensis (strain ATCC 49424 / DSM 5305 / JCM 21570 / IAM 15109 / NBRC 103401 / IFAM 1448) TaxID=756272 RepID=F0SLT4_RUBBR|nr:DUF1501 domain-containing protein [Rubinisphaera brasiliensis]ADY58825.1 protein of unknown function DUF1501 [Rubinisphaera brasiliensis DSM 5305]